ncbi:MAG: hypothetical protein HC908_10005 [Calothrix sp. SM1_7_51]|nr:hypothetical protein [Calothrix sp. SM1_7_51]
MDTPLINTTLIALLLALRSLEEPLNQVEQEKLFEVGEQLQTDPTKWEDIQSRPNDYKFPANSSLKELYQIFYENLSIKYDSLQRLLSTEAELVQEVPQDIYVEVRGYFEGQPDIESNEILNVTVVVLKTEDPVTMTTKLSFLERIQNFLNKGLSN